MKRYIKNMNTLTFEENEKLKTFKVCVVGCGGLGGYIIEMLGRLGIGKLTVIDYDCFDETNLNRQLLSKVDTLGHNKALESKKRMENINPYIQVTAIQEKLTKNNGEDYLKGHDVIVDAVDSISTRLLIQTITSKLDIPMVHGAIAGWYGQVSTIFPGDDTLNCIYRNRSAKGIERDLGNPSFSPALVASIQVSEIIKVLIKRGELLRNKLLSIDLLEHEYTVIPLDLK